MREVAIGNLLPTSCTPIGVTTADRSDSVVTLMGDISCAFSFILSLLVATQSSTADGVTDEEKEGDGLGLRVFVFLPKMG